MFSSKAWILGLALLGLAACKDVGDDLLPSADDQRPASTTTATGGTAVDEAPDLSAQVYQSDGQAVAFSDLVARQQVSVFYFTMWCPICASHQSHLTGQTMPNYPQAGYYLIDYVSGSVAGAAQAMREAGFAGSGFELVTDLDQAAVAEFNGTMGIVLVFDQAGNLLMNEDFKDGSRLEAKLAEALR